MNPQVLGFSEYTEELEDIGAVPVFVEDLNRRWEFENERNRVYLTEDEAVWTKTWELPVSIPVAWDYMALPDKRILWNVNITSFEPQTPGRQSVGSVNHCMHGPDLIIEHVADWRPFHYFTMDYPLGPDSGDYIRMTYEFDDKEDPPTATLRVGGAGAGFETWLEEAGQAQFDSIEAGSDVLYDLWDDLEGQVP